MSQRQSASQPPSSASPGSPTPPSASPSLTRSHSSSSSCGQRGAGQPPLRQSTSRHAPWPKHRTTSSASSSPSLSVPPHPPRTAASSSPPQPHLTSHRWDREVKAASANSTTSPLALGMSPLAQALQAQWRQLQQDMLSPSTLHLDRRTHTSAEDDVLRVLRSIASWAEMAVEDAAHTVPYLLAFAVAPLPSVKTQVVALAALRGVLSSLPGVYGTEAAREFVEDIFLGEHEALQALSLCALVAIESSTRDSSGSETSGLHLSSTLSLKPRSGRRSLLSRGDSHVVSETLDALRATPARHAGSSSHSMLPSRDGEARQNKSAVLQTRLVHLSLRLLHDAATLCPAVADALLSCDALLKAALRALTKSLTPTAQGSPRQDPPLLTQSAKDILRLLLTLLTSENAQHNEAALVLCSYDALHAVCTLAQSLAYRSYDARGAVREAADEEASGGTQEDLLWTSLKVLTWLTRGCPSGMKHCLSANTTIPAFIAQVLTVPVAEIREAAALWLAALLETQAHASLQLVKDLLDGAPPASSSTVQSSASAMGALIDMLRWRGAQMRIYGVAAIVCWRWMLLSHPTRMAAVLQKDPSLLATLMELLFQAQTKTSHSTSEGSGSSLPLHLVALEAVHVFALSYALGSLETRTRLEAQLVGGALSSTTLHRLREAALAMVAATHPSYYDDFPAMEVKLAEPELSEAMQRAGAVVCPSASDVSTAQTSMSALSPRPQTSVVVRISAGAQWRQLILESIAELTAGVPAQSTALVTTRSVSPLASSARSSSLPSRRRQHGGLHAARPFGSPRITDLDRSAHRAARSVAPVRVLGAMSRQDGAGKGAHNGLKPQDHGEEEEEEEHRIDIASIINASLADGQDGAVAPPANVPSHVPRTVREATLLPTSQSTTALRYRVVQQAEGLGGLFVQDSMRVVLQLAQHYTTSQSAAVVGVSLGVSSKLVRAVQDTRRVSRTRGSAKTRHIDVTVLDTPTRLRGSSPSAVFGSAPRFGRAPHKEGNPFAPPPKTSSAHRAWTVQELQREDVLLFLIRYTHLMTELPEAIAAVEDHLYYLRRQLQLCPTREVRRRCVLNDLYMNVYPSTHLFLRFINQQARRSRGVLQLLSSLNGGTIHSGNVVEVYDAVGQCTGLSVEL